MNIPDEVLRQTYNRAVAATDKPYPEAYMEGLRAIAEWARKEALKEAAEEADSMALRVADEYHQAGRKEAFNEIADAMETSYYMGEELGWVVRRAPIDHIIIGG